MPLRESLALLSHYKTNMMKYDAPNKEEYHLRKNYEVNLRVGEFFPLKPGILLTGDAIVMS